MSDAFKRISTTIIIAHDYTRKQCDYPELNPRIVIIAGFDFFILIDNNAKCHRQMVLFTLAACYI